MGVISWIFWGLFVGLIARLLLPGRQKIGIVLTIALGVIGAVLGGLFATEVLSIGDTDDFDFGSFIVAVGASVVLLALYQGLTGGSERRDRKREAREERSG